MVYQSFPEDIEVIKNNKNHIYLPLLPLERGTLGCISQKKRQRLSLPSKEVNYKQPLNSSLRILIFQDYRMLPITNLKNIRNFVEIQ